MALIKECCRTQCPADAMFLQAKTGDFSIIGSIHFRGDKSANWSQPSRLPAARTHPISRSHSIERS
jgi:hypothetical protein